MSKIWPRIGETHRFSLRAEALHIHKSLKDNCWIVRCTAPRCQRDIWTRKEKSQQRALQVGQHHAYLVHGARI